MAPVHDPEWRVPATRQQDGCIEPATWFAIAGFNSYAHKAAIGRHLRATPTGRRCRIMEDRQMAVEAGKGRGRQVTGNEFIQLIRFSGSSEIGLRKL